MICPVHGEVGEGFMEPTGSGWKPHCNMPEGWGNPMMVAVSGGMGPVGPRPTQLCRTLLEYSPEEAKQRQRAFDAENEFNRGRMDELLGRLDGASSKEKVAEVLRDMNEVLNRHDFVGRAKTLRAAWVRHSTAGLFGPPTHDIVTCTARWNCTKKGVFLELEEMNREPAWLAANAGNAEIDEGMDSITTLRFDLDVWVDRGGDILTQECVRVARNLSTHFYIDDRATSRPHTVSKRRDQFVKPIGEMLIAVAGGGVPTGRTDKWGRETVTGGFTNAVHLGTHKPARSRHRVEYDLTSAMITMGTAT